MEEAAQGATESSGGRAPGDERRVVERCRVHPLAPRKHVVQTDVMNPIAVEEPGTEGRGIRSVDRAAGRSALQLAVAHSSREGEREFRVDPRGVEHRQGFHVQRRRILGGVGQLHHRHRRIGGVDQQERLVTLAAQVTGGRGMDAERPGGDVQDRGFIEVGGRGRQDGVEPGGRDHRVVVLMLARW